MRSPSAVVDNMYRRGFLDGFDIRERHFELAARLARTVPVVQVVRPVEHSDRPNSPT